MDEQTQGKEVCRSRHGFCSCKAIAAALIIVFVWFWTPDWADIAITVLAALIILGCGGCYSRHKKMDKK